MLKRLSGSKIAGHRGYFLTDDGIDLNQALISYGLDFLRKKGHKKIQPPFFMNKDQMAKTAQLDQYDDELYKVPSSLDPLTRSPNSFIGDSVRRREVPDRDLRTADLRFSLRRVVRESQGATTHQIRRLLDLLQERGWLRWSRHVGYLPCPPVREGRAVRHLRAREELGTLRPDD